MTKIVKFSVFMSVSIAILIGALGAIGAQVTANQPSGQAQPLPNIQTTGIKKLLCPDLKVNLALDKGQNGLVTFNGTVANIGKGDYNIASVAQIVMNLSYPPLYSYAKTGVSEILISKNFNSLKAGAFLRIKGAFQIPNFDGWANPNLQGNAKRLFTLGVVKQDMSPYKPGEDCNPGNNSIFVEIMYREKK